MIRLQKQRESKGWSKSKLARESDLNPATITWAETRGFRLYPGQLDKLARALGFDGDPVDLLAEVSSDAG